ncbi:hypothetical protein KBTX_03129 [wastewater metagenome]|uniref:O-antigen ligase-related domain-containing protein n=2 Tax=unclassified sequences TaxID=12908 RepID=A0A5B8RG04_9ZZZZ|nr:O-antigen ligase family protein [Arhodomonas aquaeolei]QEA06788.1 hypothetical protein KBTEX_03129 [uncultured organism]
MTESLPGKANVRSDTHYVMTGWDRVVSVGAILALLLLGSGALMGVAMGNVALVLLLVAFVVDAPRARVGLTRSPFVWLTLVYLGFLVLQLALGPLRPAVPMAAQFEAFKSYIAVGYLAALAAGYWLYRKPEWQFTVFMLLPAGLLVRVAEKWQPGDFTGALYGHGRFRFGDSAVDFGFWSLVVAIFALTLIRGACRMRSPLRRNAALAYLVSVFVLALVSVVLAKTRSVWLIVPVALPLAAVLGVGPRVPRRYWLRAAVAGGLVLVALCLAIAWGAGDIIAGRWEKGQHALDMLVQGNWEALGNGSVGLRAKMAYEGLSIWWQQPVLGHGFASAPELLAHSRFEAVATRGFRHFHNTAITIMVEHGIIGLGLFLALFVFCVVTLFRALCDDVTGVAGGVFVSLVAMTWQSMADHVIEGYRNPFMIALFCGVAVALHLSRPGRGGDQLSAAGRQ